jgi:hypothetical protein
MIQKGHANRSHSPDGPIRTFEVTGTLALQKMDLNKMLAELRTERRNVEQAILTWNVWR